ncbi:MAG: DUF5916 domain-containing protein [Candidatus Eisenbacteria bacterium]|nr:DUF5916 domain-containing protein [Candidatus Eisenbacteria bacterium]
MSRLISLQGRVRPAGHQPVARIQIVSSRVTAALLLFFSLPPVTLSANQSTSTPADSVATPGPPATRTYTTRRCDTPPILDGVLEDACWETVEWATEFTGWEPEAGVKPSQATAFKILYTDDALYIAYRAFDTDPDRIANRLARRDWFPGDWVEINIDSRKDGRTAYSFTSSVSGTRGDEFVSNDGDDWDDSWDPIWDLKTRVDDQGWTAEVRIPFSQLRFSNTPDQTWGIQVTRRVFREEERSLWQPFRREDTGWVSRFGQLNGLKDLGASRRIEVFPYLVARGERFPKEDGNVFADGSDSGLSGGVDAKTGITNDLTLDVTVNPDFGQVEADPSEVNLTAFETFFEEKRPFFIEGKNITDFPVAPAITGGSFTQDNLFYSRRIGKSPIYSPDLADAEYSSQPENTSIIGAAKITGKTSGGLSLGILESVTAREMADIDGPGGRRQEEVEPLSNYFVGRAQQDYGQGTTQIGGMLTAVHRRIDDARLDFLHQSAWVGGADLFHRWSDRTWYLAVDGAASRVAGDPTALIRTQRASARLFQRPDNDRAGVDSSVTSLAGHAGSLRLGRGGGQGFRFQVGGAWRSPGFEINDLGFLHRADEINQFAWASYRQGNPFSIFRTAQINTNQWLTWDFGGDLLIRQFDMNSNAQFKNNWRAGLGVTKLFEHTSNHELRGGPSFRLPGTQDINAWVETDSRYRIQFNAGLYHSFGQANTSRTNSGELGATIEPSNALRISANAEYSRNRKDLQYVRTISSDLGTRYLLGQLDQKTLSLTFRVDYTLIPNLTLQYYGSPFIAAGQYDTFRRVTNSRADNYEDRTDIFSDNNIAYIGAEAEYAVDENGDGQTDYRFSDPDFNIRDFNSNLVARWEFQPGSVLFVVWSQARSDFAPVGRFSAGDDLNSLFDAPGNNVFLVKVSKWFSL